MVVVGMAVLCHNVERAWIILWCGGFFLFFLHRSRDQGGEEQPRWTKQGVSPDADRKSLLSEIGDGVDRGTLQLLPTQEASLGPDFRAGW